MSVEIVEILRRAEQGVTRPFICRGDDGKIYFVKGRYAGKRSLICEWIAGKLALELGLPVPPFRILDVPAELVETPSSLNLEDLGSGPVFGSEKQEVVELNISMVQGVPEGLQLDVLAFDWWVHNADRNLTDRGGNPNLFWNPASRELVVIDHNQAFTPDFDPECFVQLHVFSEQRHQLFNDMLKRQEYQERFRTALGNWSQILGQIPEEWMFADPEMTVPVDFIPDDVLQFLERYDKKDFWISA